MNKKVLKSKFVVVAMGLILVALLGLMSVVAIEKTLKLDLVFSATPEILCKIEAKSINAPDEDYTTIFDNSQNNFIGEGLILNEDRLVFSSTFTNAYAGKLGASFMLRVTNYMPSNGLKMTASGEGASASPGYIVMKEYSTTNELDTNTITISGVSASSNLSLTFVEYNVHTVTTEPPSGNFTFTGSSEAVDGEDYSANVVANMGYYLSISISNDGNVNTLVEGQDYVWDSATGDLVVYGEVVTGDIVINCVAGPSTYAINYTLNGGTNAAGNPKSYTIETETFTLLAPTRDGYNFTGWTGSNGSTPSTSVSITKGSTGAKSYTANWSVVTYSVSYSLNNGTATGSNPTSYNITSEGVTLANPTRSGYSFDGWTGSNGDVPQKKVIISQGTTGNLTYTANWLTNYTLKTGQVVNQAIKQLALGDASATHTTVEWSGCSVIFGKYSTYSSKFPTWTSGTTMDASNAGTIRLFADTENNTYYILSTGAICGNADSSYLLHYFMGTSGKNTVLDFGNFYTDNITNMSYMVSYFGSNSATVSILNYEHFNTSKVTNMSYTFQGVKASTLDLSGWNTSKVTTMASMFSTNYLTSLDIGSFNTSLVTDMSYMFSQSMNLTSLDLSNFNTSKVTTMRNMFSNSSKLESINLSSFSTPVLTTMESMFQMCTKLKSIDVSNFNTSKVTSFYYTFQGLIAVTSINLSGLNTSNATTMYGMFGNCSVIEIIDIRSFNTSKVTSMDSMFSSCSNLTTIYVGSGWTTASVSKTGIGWSWMFNGCSKLPGFSSSSGDYAHTGAGGYLTLV